MDRASKDLLHHPICCLCLTICLRVVSRDGPARFWLERERERVQFPFPFPFLSFRSRARYYRSRVHSLSVPVSVPGACSFFLERIWNRPVPVSVITIPVFVPTRSSFSSWAIPGFCSGHFVFQWNGACDGPVLVTVITIPSTIFGLFPDPFLVSSTLCYYTLQLVGPV